MVLFSTGVRLLQFPEGVDWGDGQIVYLAIGIAAKSDEHLRLLQLRLGLRKSGTRSGHIGAEARGL